MERISVIVPVFHGRKYIDSMIAQIEKCAVMCCGGYSLELLFVNDDPDEPIGARASEKVEIKVIETDVNRGIHGARVRGLERCTGDYVLFFGSGRQDCEGVFCESAGAFRRCRCCSL